MGDGREYAVGSALTSLGVVARASGDPDVFVITPAGVAAAPIVLRALETPDWRVGLVPRALAPGGGLAVERSVPVFVSSAPGSGREADSASWSVVVS